MPRAMPPGETCDNFSSSAENRYHVTRPSNTAANKFRVYWIWRHCSLSSCDADPARRFQVQVVQHCLCEDACEKTEVYTTTGCTPEDSHRVICRGKLLGQRRAASRHARVCVHRPCSFSPRVATQSKDERASQIRSSALCSFLARAGNFSSTCPSLLQHPPITLQPCVSQHNYTYTPSVKSSPCWSSRSFSFSFTGQRRLLLSCHDESQARFCLLFRVSSLDVPFFACRSPPSQPRHRDDNHLFD